MEDLIDALLIFRKYTNDRYPTICEHDVLYVLVNPEDVSEVDKQRLRDLGFFDSGDGSFLSHRFGSA